MFHVYIKLLLVSCCFLFFGVYSINAQYNFKLKYKNSLLYAGIDVGSKGVKLSVLEIGKNAKKSGSFNVLKDTAINTDFISFTQPTFQATLNSLYKLYSSAIKQYHIPVERIFIVFSSGVKTQAEKENKFSWIKELSDSFRLLIREPNKQLSVIDVIEEARLSHLGIIPETKRYTTFLIDIGSGNTKGGYFPNGNTKDLKLFQLTWGTKSVANETEKRCAEDKSVANFNRQLYRVLAGDANSEIIYAVNSSGAYNMSDYIAFSGGIAWSVATLLYPELIENSVVPVTYDEVVKFIDRMYKNYGSLSNESIVKTINDKTLDIEAIGKEVKRVNQVFDQKSLMAGAALLLKIMRQFEGIYEKKQFYLVKSGQVGWISAYVDQNISK
ncbi:MAG: hypothetical protein ACR2KX_13335 [Chitinophagaceae bacterium]